MTHGAQDAEVARGEALSGEGRVAALAEALPDAVLLVDGEGRIRWGNGAAADLFGMSLEQGIGRNGLDFVHPDDLQLALVSLSSIQGKEVGTPLEMRLRSAQGWRLVEMLGASVPEGILLTLRDLTDRRRWEVAGDKTARFRSLIQYSTSINLLMTGDGIVTSSSGGLTRQLGIDQEWLEGRAIHDLVDPDDHARLAEAFADILGDAGRGGRTAARATLDLGLRAAGGEVIPFAMTFTDLLDDPTVEGVLATGHEVSDRVRTEAELLAANSTLAATLESTVDGVLVVDSDGTVVVSNSRFWSVWGLDPELRDGMPHDEVLAAMVAQVDDSAAFMARVAESDEDPRCTTHDLVECRDGRAIERWSMPQRIDGEVVGRVWSFHDLTEQRRLQDELAHQAFHDSLTGLANQALFRDRVDHAVTRLRRHGGRLAVVFLDLDDFKNVNDSLGHSVGDELLVLVSERIRDCLRPGDTAARLGGDEFAVLIEDVSDDRDAERIAARILDRLSEPVRVASTQVSSAASIGIAYGDDAAGVDELLRNADLAMYNAKSAGKNCARVYESAMHRAALERLDLDAHLRGASLRGELEVEYQPIVELATGRVRAVEALVRWNHPIRGRLGPGAFIPFAEQGGLIEEIGHHVLDTACREAAGWVEQFGDAAPTVSVNLSPRQLSDPDLPERVEDLLSSAGLAAERLVLEITESALMEDPDAAVTSLERLARLGISLAVDDFGTGYSSLASLQRFPVDLLKIDGSFIGDDLTGTGWSLAEAIVQISHALGLVPIAEGVETAEQAAALAGCGCELAQGYHFARPMPSDRLTPLLAGRTPAVVAGG